MRGVIRVLFAFVGCRNCHELCLRESLDGRFDPVVRRRLFKIEQGLERCWDLVPG
jgi:hypothetical protein